MSDFSSVSYSYPASLTGYRGSVYSYRDALEKYGEIKLSLRIFSLLSRNIFLKSLDYLKRDATI